MKYKEEIGFQKTFEGYMDLIGNKYSDYENLSKTSSSGEVDAATRNRILNVDNFNKWLSEMSYRSGLIGRTDKLSPNMVEQYFLDQGVECDEREIREFMETIRKTWQKR